MTILQNAGLETAASRHLKTDAQLDKFLTLLDAKGLSSLKDAPAVAKCFRDSQLKGAPRQAQTRAQRAPSRRRPANEVTADCADALLDMSRKQGRFKGKSDGYINDFRKYMADHDTDDLNPQEVDKALDRFRKTRTGALAQARPGLVKTPGVHGGGLGKRREAPSLEANTFGADGLTPLMKAVQDRASPEKIAGMLNAGADPTLIVPRPETKVTAVYGQLQKRAERYLDSVKPGSKIPPVDFVHDVLIHLSPSMDNFTPEHRSPHNGQNALTMAIDCGAPQEVIDSICIWTVSKKQGEKGWNLVNQRDGNGDLPLALAIKKNNSPACVKLLASEAEVDAMNGDNRTPLMLAAQKNNCDLVTTLMEQGANSLPVVPDHMTPLSLAILDVNKEEVAKRADVLHRLLDATPHHFASLCQSVNEEREANEKSNAAEVLIRLMRTLCSFDSDPFKDSPKVKAHAADCLTGCLTIATQSLSGVQLLELLPHLKGSALDRMEKVVSEKLPRDFERMVGPPAASAHLWIKTYKAFDEYAEFAEKNVRPIWHGLDRIHMTRALESVCAASNVFDASTLLETITRSEQATALNLGAVRILMKRLPSEWKRLFKSSLDEPGSKDKNRGLRVALSAALHRLPRREELPCFRQLALDFDHCRERMWRLAFEHFGPKELSELIKSAGASSKTGHGREWNPSFDMARMFQERGEVTLELDQAGGQGQTGDVGKRFVDGFRLMALLVRNDPRFGSWKGASLKWLQLVSASYCSLTRKTRLEVLGRLDKAEMSVLRQWIDVLSNSVVSASERKTVLTEIDEFLRRKK